MSQAAGPVLAQVGNPGGGRIEAVLRAMALALREKQFCAGWPVACQAQPGLHRMRTEEYRVP